MTLFAEQPPIVLIGGCSVFRKAWKIPFSFSLQIRCLLSCKNRTIVQQNIESISIQKRSAFLFIPFFQKQTETLQFVHILCNKSSLWFVIIHVR